MIGVAVDDQSRCSSSYTKDIQVGEVYFLEVILFSTIT